MNQDYIVKTLDVHKNLVYLENVVQLGRKYSSTLGFFPDGAFLDYALKKQILILLDPNKKVIGYLLYRVSKQKVSITHLCIDSSCREKGLSRLLVERLQNETCGLKGIGLFCRRDYQVNRLWPKLGFVPVNEKKGRGSTAETLTYWWLDYRIPDLFTKTIENELKDKTSIVIDANIFYDLDQSKYKAEGVESKALDADWFKGEISVFVTDEIYTEINRRDDEIERNNQRARVHEFNVLVSNKDDVIELVNKLTIFLRKPRKEQDHSDIRQLAHAISGGADYFITRDDYLLKQADRIYELYDLNIRRPAEIILEVDNLYNEVCYRPARLAGTLSTLKLVTRRDLDLVVANFCLDKQGEKRNILKNKLATILSQPTQFRVFIAKNNNGSELATYATTIAPGNSTRVCFARVKDGPLGLTLARYILAKLIRDTPKEQLHSIIFSDEYIQASFSDALHKEGFLRSGQEWVRLIIKGPVQLRSLIDMIEEHTRFASNIFREEFLINIHQVIKNVITSNDKYSSMELERLIWPGKVADIDIPCYIIPIRHGWARELFDENLANADLFGADLNLAIQNEGVYYYSIRGAKTTAPARILWYVCQDKKIPGSAAIRACSTLKEVIVDFPKPIFNKYRRLGVYKWHDVLKTAKNNCNNKIAAVHFGQTELFSTVIQWEQIQQMLDGLGINKSLISATPISSDVFMKIYRLGMNI